MSETPRAAQQRESAHAYWRANERLIKGLLAIWAVVGLGCGVLFVEPLNRLHIGTVPFGFWMAQQGSIDTFVILIFYYAWRMDQLDGHHGVG